MEPKAELKDQIAKDVRAAMDAKLDELLKAVDIDATEHGPRMADLLDHIERYRPEEQFSRALKALRFDAVNAWLWNRVDQAPTAEDKIRMVTQMYRYAYYNDDVEENRRLENQTSKWFTGYINAPSVMVFVIERAAKVLSVIRDEYEPYKADDLDFIFDPLMMRANNLTKPDEIKRAYRFMSGKHPEMALTRTSDAIMNTMKRAEGRMTDRDLADLGIFFLDEFKPDYGEGSGLSCNSGHYTRALPRLLLTAIKRIDDPAAAFRFGRKLYHVCDTKVVGCNLKEDILSQVKKNVRTLKQHADLGSKFYKDAYEVGIVWLNERLTNDKNYKHNAPYFREALQCLLHIADKELFAPHRKYAYLSIAESAGRPFVGRHICKPKRRIHCPSVLAKANNALRNEFGEIPKHPKGFQPTYWGNYAIGFIRHAFA